MKTRIIIAIIIEKARIVFKSAVRVTAIKHKLKKLRSL